MIQYTSRALTHATRVYISCTVSTSRARLRNASVEANVWVSAHAGVSAAQFGREQLGWGQLQRESIRIKTIVRNS